MYTALRSFLLAKRSRQVCEFSVLDVNQFVRYLGSSAQFLAARGLQKKSES